MPPSPRCPGPVDEVLTALAYYPLFQRKGLPDQGVHPLLVRAQGIAAQLTALDEEFVASNQLLANPAFHEGRNALLARVEIGLAFDGPTLLPVAIETTPVSVRVTASTSRYSTSAALRACHRDAPGLFPLLPTKELPASSVGVNTLVITAEGWVLAGTRSVTATVNPAMRFFGFGEGAEPSDDGDMAKVSRRCVKEELGVSLTAAQAKRIKVVALARYSATGSWGAYAVFDARGLGPTFTAKALLESAATAPDAWEACQLQALSPGNLLAFAQEAACTPCAPFWLGLLDLVYPPPAK